MTFRTPVVILRLIPAFCLLLLGTTPGCIVGSRPSFVSSGSEAIGKTYYLDGAGNLGFGKESVPIGLADGGYRGHVEHFIWTTYMGITMDQVSLGHNRRKGQQLARKIEKYLRKNPGGHVNIVALSAGTGVAVFAVEELRPPFRVDNLVLLSSSLSSRYNLTKALRKVNGGIYFFWSPDDPVLDRVVPVVGTVDRKSDATPAGTHGARLPWAVSDETRDLYRRKVHNLEWHPRASSGFIILRHAGSTSRDLIRTLVAPILVARTPPSPAPLPATAPTGRDPIPGDRSSQDSSAGHVYSVSPARPDTPATRPAPAPALKHLAP